MSEKEKDPTYKGKIFEAMSNKTLGSLIIRPIVDKGKALINGKPSTRLYRKVDNGISGEIINNAKAGLSYFSIPDFQNFEEAGTILTDYQKKLLVKIRKYLYDLKVGFFQPESIKNNQFPEIYKRLPRIEFKRQIVYFYGKLISHIDTSNKLTVNETIGQIRIFSFSKGAVGSNDFITANKKSVESKNLVMGEKTWLRDYYVAVHGTYDKVIITNVSKTPTTGDEPARYSLSVNYETCKPFTITEDDLSLVKNLDDGRYRCSRFDDDYYEMLKDGLSEIKNVIEACGYKAVPKPEKKTNT